MANKDGSIAASVLSFNLTYYNVTLQYSNGTYSKVDEVVSDRFLSDGYSGPLRADTLTRILVDDLQLSIITNNITDAERTNKISQELVRMVIASAGVSANTIGPTLSQSEIQTNFLRQYPILPMFLLLIVF